MRDSGLELLFKGALAFTSQAESEAVVATDGHDGAFLGSGDGTLTGGRIHGKIRWSIWSGNCLYPAVRKGQPVTEGMHLCTLNPGGFIETSDGARIRFEMRGYGLRYPDGHYRTGGTMAFGTEDARYAWLTKAVAVMEGDFDEKAASGTWNVYFPKVK